MTVFLLQGWSTIPHRQRCDEERDDGRGSQAVYRCSGMYPSEKEKDSIEVIPDTSADAYNVVSINITAEYSSLCYIAVKTESLSFKLSLGYLFVWVRSFMLSSPVSAQTVHALW